MKLDKIEETLQGFASALRAGAAALTHGTQILEEQFFKRDSGTAVPAVSLQLVHGWDSRATLPHRLHVSRL